MTLAKSVKIWVWIFSVSTRMHSKEATLCHNALVIFTVIMVSSYQCTWLLGTSTQSTADGNLINSDNTDLPWITNIPLHIYADLSIVFKLKYNQADHQISSLRFNFLRLPILYWSGNSKETETILVIRTKKFYKNLATYWKILKAKGKYQGIMEEIIARSCYHPQQLGEQREEVIMTKTDVWRRNLWT